MISAVFTPSPAEGNEKPEIFVFVVSLPEMAVSSLS
jgi:hypothetical protein